MQRDMMAVDADNNNQVSVSGVVMSYPVFSYRRGNQDFYVFEIYTGRLSKITDSIMIMAAGSLLDERLNVIGQTVYVKGQYRSYNKHKHGSSHLLLYVFAYELCLEDAKNVEKGLWVKETAAYRKKGRGDDRAEDREGGRREGRGEGETESRGEVRREGGTEARAEDRETDGAENSIYLNGFLCKPPYYRVTGRGIQITDVVLAVNRANQCSDYIPCIFWNKNARYVKSLAVGDHLEVWGRIQSRTFRKRIHDTIEVTRTVNEVSVNRLNLLGSNRKNPVSGTNVQVSGFQDNLTGAG